MGRGQDSGERLPIRPLAAAETESTTSWFLGTARSTTGLHVADDIYIVRAGDGTVCLRTRLGCCRGPGHPYDYETGCLRCAPLEAELLFDDDTTPAAVTQVSEQQLEEMRYGPASIDLDPENRFAWPGMAPNLKVWREVHDDTFTDHVRLSFGNLQFDLCTLDDECHMHLDGGTYFLSECGHAELATFAYALMAV